MKKDIHPEYNFIEVTMTDGSKYVTRSTLANNAQLVIDPLNHPAYTGKRRQVDSEGRIDKFNKRFNASAAAKYLVRRLKKPLGGFFVGSCRGVSSRACVWLCL